MGLIMFVLIVPLGREKRKGFGSKWNSFLVGLSWVFIGLFRFVLSKKQPSLIVFGFVL